MSRKMRYLSERKNGDYRYVRDYPTKLLRAIPSHPKQFSKELGLDKSCSDSELLKAMEEATRLYDLRVKTASNSDPNAFSESELKMAVLDFCEQELTTLSSVLLHRSTVILIAPRCRHTLKDNIN